MCCIQSHTFPSITEFTVGANEFLKTSGNFWCGHVKLYSTKHLPSISQLSNMNKTPAVLYFMLFNKLQRKLYSFQNADSNAVCQTLGRTNCQDQKTTQHRLVWSFIMILLCPVFCPVIASPHHQGGTRTVPVLCQVSGWFTSRSSTSQTALWPRPLQRCHLDTHPCQGLFFFFLQCVCVCVFSWPCRKKERCESENGQWWGF